jgi:predicted MFS family arabinose efflux permease
LGGYLSVLAGVAWLHAAPGATGFAAGADLLCLGWNFCVPQLLGAVAASDTTGRSMSTVNLAFALGLAIGPLLAGALIAGMGLPAVLPFTLAGLALCTWLTLALTRASSP